MARSLCIEYEGAVCRGTQRRKIYFVKGNYEEFPGDYSEELVIQQLPRHMKGTERVSREAGK